MTTNPLEACRSPSTEYHQLHRAFNSQGISRQSLRNIFMVLRPVRKKEAETSEEAEASEEAETVSKEEAEASE
jgi:hypothetical protein